MMEIKLNNPILILGLLIITNFYSQNDNDIFSKKYSPYTSVCENIGNSIIEKDTTLELNSWYEGNEPERVSSYVNILIDDIEKSPNKKSKYNLILLHEKPLTYLLIFSNSTISESIGHLFVHFLDDGNFLVDDVKFSGKSARKQLDKEFKEDVEKGKIPPPPPPPAHFFAEENEKKEDELRDLRKLLKNQATSLGKEANLNLDFSDNSISDLEKYLSLLHEDYIKTENDEGLNGLAHILGFYIIEVIEKNHGKGKLARNHIDFGENTFPFYWNKSTLFPVAWCQKRIYDGDADNVETKYKVFVIEKE